MVISRVPQADRFSKIGISRFLKKKDAVLSVPLW
jgi:hypothetical protein